MDYNGIDYWSGNNDTFLAGPDGLDLSDTAPAVVLGGPGPTHQPPFPLTIHPHPAPVLPMFMLVPCLPLRLN
jgi:hypothetical protein